MDDARAVAEALFNAKVEPFHVEDTFNPHTLTGYMCRQQGQHYGSMLITHVDNTVCRQVVRATPKIYYPFDKRRSWKFPKSNLILGYDKLDGTNILLYRYLTADGWPVYTYKTRLLPVVRLKSARGFHGKWKKMLNKYPAIGKELWEANGCNVSFELYGYLNAHTIIYDIPLDCVILFGRRGDGAIIAPADLNTCDVPTAELKIKIDSDYVYNYKLQQQRMNDNLKSLGDPLQYKGDEGQVWYCYTKHGVIQLKCKPDTIESLHMSAGKGLSDHCIKTTIYNAYENKDHVTLKDVEELLREEFHSDIVKVNRKRIRLMMGTVKGEIDFNSDVMETYRKLKIGILEDKRAVMRVMSEFYSKSKMRHVYQIIAANEGIL